MHRFLQIKALLAAVVAILGTASAGNAANLIVNGDFETGSLAPWTVNPGPSGDAIGVDAVPAFGGGTTAVDGNFIAAFNGGNTPPGGSISQTFATTAGVTYTVQYDVGATGGGNQTLLAEVFGNNGTTLLNSQLAPGTNPPTAPLPNSFTFVADGAKATLTFLDSPTNPTDSQDVLLDNVSVTGQAGVVPEPASLALLGVGAMGLVLRARRRIAA